MKRKNKNRFRTRQKQKGRAVKIILIISGLLMTGLVVWIALNDWDVEKSLNKITSTNNEDKKVDETEEQPESTGILEIPDENAELPSTSEPEMEPENDEKTVVESPDTGDSDVVGKSPARIDNGGYVEEQELPSEPTYVKGILIANKKFPLPSTFAPGEDKEARASFDEMAAKAALVGFNLTAFSTYRSFDYQTELYERYVSRDGKEAADRYSARPGYSEHQTGLAFDVGEVNFEKHWASSTFGDTEAGKWVADNAHRFGFVMRYPLGKEKVTGYMHESWHYRYVGKNMATEIFKQKTTLEEHLGI